MELKDEELKGGRLWFVLAGAAAIVLAVALRFIDNRLSASPREQVLGATLKELRTAQSSIPSRSTDPRQVGPMHTGPASGAAPT